MWEEGCPLDEEAPCMAAAAGQLDALKWLRSVGCPWDITTYIAAQRLGDAELLLWLRENDVPQPPLPAEFSLR
jgi:hypothetical protein